MMSQVHLPVQVQAPFSNERMKPGEKPQALVARLSQEKAESVRKIVLQRYPSSLILAADTVVVAPVGRSILGKPKDPDEAVKMLKLLAGKTHLVFTGYCALLVTRKKADRKIARVVQTKVKMRVLNGKTIAKYVATGESLDKAGAYAAQGLGMALIESIQGSYTNIVGLPIAQVFMDFERVFKIKLFSWENDEN